MTTQANHADYIDFLRAKACLAIDSGFEVADAGIHPLLKPHQRAIVRWSVRGGRRAVFAAFGLGKSVIQLEILRLVLAHLAKQGKGSGRALIVAPLGVRQEFIRDAQMLGLCIRFVRWSHEVEECGPGLYITNYESIRDGRLNPDLFDALSLDEASVLRSYGSKTFQTFLDLCAQVPYRFVATATPSPNRYKELIHYSGFLGVMDTGMALTRFFQRNSEKAGDLTLYPHMEQQFWLWLNSWAVFLQKPSDLGYDDAGYELPELRVHWHEIASDAAKDIIENNGQSRLFRDASAGLTAAAAEKRDSLPLRIAKMTEILSAPENEGDHFILWHDLEAERYAIKQALPDAVSIYGTQDLEEREQEVIDFSEGRFQYLSAKAVFAGSGCNFQRHCHKMLFLGVGYKFNDWIQAIHRCLRYLQAHPVDVHIIYTEAEREIVKALKRKWIQHEEMTRNMSDIIREHGLSTLALKDALVRAIGVERIEARGERFIAANNDTVVETRGMDSESVDLIVSSIPFGNHYEYCESYNDFGHSENNDHFWQQMDFLTPELLRVLRPGRLACIHVKDRVLFGSVTGAGAPTVSPFHCEAILHYRKHGFDYMGMITVVTDVVRENNQTYRLGWSEQCKDGSKMGVGSPEYVLLFRRPQTDRTRGYADVPVTKEKVEYSRSRWQVDAHAFWRSSGDHLLTAGQLAQYDPGTLAKLFTEWSLQTVYDYETHVKIGEELDGRGALPSVFMSLAPGSHHPDVWTDVNRMLTLNSTQSQKGRVLHVCPLQLDIVYRLINRYSNEGELVYDPFAGIMTVPYCALKIGRRGRGVELNTGYFLDGVQYLKSIEADITAPSLFDAIDAEERTFAEQDETREYEAIPA